MKQSIVVGGGMLARAFKNRIGEFNSACIFASGVSNSSCTDEREFNRERNLLESVISQTDKEITIVYFSTCSVYDDAIKRTSYYIDHKLKMENIVLNRSNSSVFRLPQVAGNSNNSMTLLNYLSNSIDNGNTIFLEKNAYRNIIDVNDVVFLCKCLLETNQFKGRVSNIANTYNVSVIEIVNLLEKIKMSPPNIELRESGSNYNIDVSDVHQVMKSQGVYFGNEYVECVLRKYYGKINQQSMPKSCLTII